MAITIRKMRRAINLTQQKVSDFLAIRQSSYQKYEAGLVVPPPDKLAKLADLFGVTTDYLLGRETQPPTESALRDVLAMSLKSKFNEFIRAATPDQMFALEKAIEQIKDAS